MKWKQATILGAATADIGRVPNAAEKSERRHQISNNNAVDREVTFISKN